MNRGDIAWALPPVVSADIQADVLGNGNIVIAPAVSASSGSKQGAGLIVIK